MLSINARVGFKVHKRTVDYQITRDALESVGVRHSPDSSRRLRSSSSE